MSGEASKKSGELGEKLTKEFFKLIGWDKALTPVGVQCALQEKHRTKSHGDDSLFIYNSPFSEGITDVVHVSVKHRIDGYNKGDQGVRTELKSHLSELNEIVACARVSPEVKRVIDSHPGKQKKVHRGLLVWMHSDEKSLQRDIRQGLGGIQLSAEHSIPVFLVDTGRASFIYDAIRHNQNLGLESYDFYYPRLGSSLSADHERAGKVLPLELIASDVLPIRGMQNGKPLLYLYIREKFSVHALKKACALAQDFGDAWVDNINIGFEDYNESIHSQFRDEALLAFEHKTKVSVFSYKGGLLSLLEGKA